MKISRAIALATAMLVTLVPTSTAADPADNEDSNVVDPALTQIVEADENITQPGHPVEISAGHVDLGPKFLDGQWTFLVRDDTAAEATWRHLDDVVFRVTDSAKTQLPEGDTNYDFINTEGDVWVVPQNEIQDVVWLGWNTQDPEVVNQLQGGVTMTYAGHEGDGDLNVFVQAGNFSGPQELWNSTKESAQPIHVDPNTHTHANWVFTTPGTHLVRITIQGQLTDGSTVEDTQILRFAVGDDADAQATLEAQWSIVNAPEEPADVAEPSAVDESADIPLYVGIGAAVLAVIVVMLSATARTRSRQRRAEARRVVESDGTSQVELAHQAEGGAK